ncbi:peptide-methionine (R)-S-oxide reductase MsrB [archaeon]|nr:peptide-methionine (R)-S-oxide reductase MsrB [archaeon]MBT4272981.1 peptide-methionine (R)-S-oxide reductase MsrB [archaeon]MBT4460928.1 peptide-methionine (R)-S-oxide reductase MsrB [archaeon]
MKYLIPLLLAALIIGCSTKTQTKKEIDLSKYDKAIFAGGCFWCIEAAYEDYEGVIEAHSGYIGGTKKNAKYDLVTSGKTDHREGVIVYFDPSIISYRALVEIYWTQIDPTDSGGQFSDRGHQYTTAIYYFNEDQKNIIEETKKLVKEKLGEEIATEVLPQTEFFLAEEYHQNYSNKNSFQYELYKKGSGRKDYIEENNCGDIFESENNDLTEIQYKVTKEGYTEPPFKNEYWDNHEDGIYVDVLTGEPLFSSLDKFDSGTGWPSFTKPINMDMISEVDDTSLGITRTEIKSKDSDSHLGHVFDDGPNGGDRYCVNSASLKFIPKEKLKEKGYEEYLELFN